jgi:Fe-S-cluster-containing hydrogenase component 2
VTYCDPPLYSLQAGCWFKLICGASFQYLPAVRSLALIYGLAGADCVDVAPDPAVVAAARSGLSAAAGVMAAAGLEFRSPLLMVSLNDGEDPHFRTAQFDADRCPSDCLRPCERVCPAQAIPARGLGPTLGGQTLGVIEARCYGCGRCLPICPIGLIEARSHVVDPAVAMAMVGQMESGIDALEIHTQVGRVVEFQRLWRSVEPWVGSLKVIAVSCPNPEGGGAIVGYLAELRRMMGPLSAVLIWQTDGRSMSGDIGAGTTHPAIKLAQRILVSDLDGFVQLAGGTNAYTVPKLEQLGLLQGARQTKARRSVAGVAYGSYARTLLDPVLDRMDQLPGDLEDYPELLSQGLALAAGLARPLKARCPDRADRYDHYYGRLQRSILARAPAPT